jgi:MoaA/NifB/PqqE/SkfB family radical SAM enzyme
MPAPPVIAENKRVKGPEKTLVWWAIKLRIFYFACVILRSPSKIRKTYKSMLQLRSNVWGGDLKKLYKSGNKYYFNQYTPGWPSRAYDELIKSELRRKADPVNQKEQLSFVFLAITRKCPMRCEHCFEWDNLNQPESFTREDLISTIDLCQNQGVLQIHFSGGEPMVRIKELIGLIRHASKKSECWVLSSGFNVTDENARLLKNAGCTGMVISIDHYIPELHDLFRGKQGSFNMAVSALRSAREAGLLTSISVCATRAFLDGGHLLPFIHFAREQGVQYIQVLEPRSVGHYEGKNVLLENKHISLLEDSFQMINHDPQYTSFPTLLYHGYHQRRVGCFSGSRSIYIDSAGDVHACPFCHTSAYNIIDWVREGHKNLPEKENQCPQFNKIA